MRNSTVLYWYTTSRHVPWSSRDQQKTRHKVPSALFQSGSTLSMSFQIIIKSLATHPAHACYSILEPLTTTRIMPPRLNGEHATSGFLPGLPCPLHCPEPGEDPPERSPPKLSSGTSFLGQITKPTITQTRSLRTGPTGPRTPPPRSSPPAAAPLPAPSRRNPCCGA